MSFYALKNHTCFLNSEVYFGTTYFVQKCTFRRWKICFFRTCICVEWNIFLIYLVCYKECVLNYCLGFLHLQWPGSYCDSQKSSCCYPTTGKPAADFGIHGLWPNYKDGTYPSNCDPSNAFKPSQVLHFTPINWIFHKQTFFMTDFSINIFFIFLH